MSYPLPPQVKEKHLLLGSLYLLRQDPLRILQERRDQYGDIFGMETIGRKAVIISRPEWAQYVLMENSRNYRKGMSYDLLRFLLGNGLLTSEGEEWKHNRKLIQPAFHKKRLEQMLGMMEQESVKVRDQLLQEKDFTDFSVALTQLALEVISKAMFSTGVEEEARMVGEQITYFNQQFVKRLNNPLQFPEWVPTPGNLQRKRAIEMVNRVVNDIIAGRQQAEHAGDDLLGMLIEARDDQNGSKLSAQQLRAEVMTIFIAGNETTANALLWTFYLLATHPEEEALLCEELKEVCPGDEPLTLEQLQKLSRLRMIIEESMRLYPPAWIIGRRPLTDDVIGGYRIEKDTNVLVPIFMLHRLPEFWEAPDQFKPERFAPGKKAPDRFVYLPFGAGPRLCIGNHFALMEMTVVLATFYRRHRLQLKPAYVAEPQPLVTLRPKDGLPAKLISQ